VIISNIQFRYRSWFIGALAQYFNALTAVMPGLAVIIRKVAGHVAAQPGMTAIL
jgi:hypothetical protein